MTDLVEPAGLTLALSAKGLVRRYQSVAALSGLDILVGRGECVALLGPNGAGKTTLLRVLGLVLRPNAGALSINGIDPADQPMAARHQVGMAGHRSFLYGELTVRENLRFYGRLYGVERLRERIEVVLEETRAAAFADQPVRTLSRGMEQRAALARAILHEPSLLLLDEPESGLDDEAQGRLADLLRRWTESGHAALVASHRIDWVAAVAQRALIMKAGRMAAEIALDGAGAAQLVARYRHVVGTAADFDNYPANDASFPEPAGTPPLPNPPPRGGEGTRRT